VRGITLTLTGDLAGARVALEESLQIAQARRMDYEVGLTLRWQAELARREGDSDWSNQAEDSARILARLGVVSVPDVVVLDRLLTVNS
jgi:hypothetical protein